jgi:hypothetical protein
MRKILFILLVPLFMSGCSDLNDPNNDYEEYYVVESYLKAQERLPSVLLSTTSPAFEEYNFEDVTVDGAEVQVHLLEGDRESNAEQIFSYVQLYTGTYVAQSNHEVLPGRTYRLNVDLPDQAGSIQAFTTIPDTFRVLDNAKMDTVVYQSEEQLEITVTPSVNDDRQSVYVFNTVALNPIRDNLTPFYEDQVSDQEDLINAGNTDSGLINEENFAKNEDGTITLQFPWLGVAFYEENRVVINTLDDNVYDFLRSQSVQLGGSTISPGEIQNAIYHIEGGIGVFGSYASDTLETFFQRPESLGKNSNSN